jgi:5'-3' exonuclease
MSSKYKVLIDADGIVYRVGFALEDVNNLEIVKHHINTTLSSYMDELKKVFVNIDAPVVILSPIGQENNFRYKIAQTLPYKGNRVAPKPKHYEYIRKILSGMEGAIVAEGQEADDTIADLASENPEKTIIVSQDKDMRQVSGWHLEPSGGDYPKRPIYYVDPYRIGSIILERTTGDKASLFATGELALYSQMMLGDTADNIPGLKGYGPVKVYEALKHQGPGNYDLEMITKMHYEDMNALNRYDEIYTLLKIGGHKND